MEAKTKSNLKTDLINQLNNSRAFFSSYFEGLTSSRLLKEIVSDFCDSYVSCWYGTGGIL
jgi:hypothetical protein